MANISRVFVTVGTTKFDKLINTVSSRDSDEVLAGLGYNHITIQYGKGEKPLPIENSSITRTPYDYKTSIHDDIEEADLVISHAGAGSCIEVLDAGKPLVVVINEDLMDNHQTELAHKLKELGHVYYTTCSGLLDTLEKMDIASLKPFEKGRPEELGRFIDMVVGV